jgi:hypothetical protein
MRGGFGDDTYLVDEAADQIFEDPDPQGLYLPFWLNLDPDLPQFLDLKTSIDKVVASVSYALANYVEYLTLAAGTKATEATGNGSNNLIVGNELGNRLKGLGGSDTLDGGDGIDTAIFEKARSSYKTEKLIQNNTTLWKVTDLATGDVDELRNIEKLEFAKATVPGYQNLVQTEVNLDVAGTPAVAYRLYKAAFARDPDLGGLGFWVSLLQQYLNPSLSPEQNPFLLEVAKNFVESPEFKAKYGVNVDNATYIRNLYKNALGRDPDEGGFNWWKANLDAGYTYRQHMLVFFSESEENKAAVAPIIATGVEYVPWVPPGA